MNTLKLLVGIFMLALVISSCKQDWNCTCYTEVVYLESSEAKIDTTSRVLEETKGNAERLCTGMADSYELDIDGDDVADQAITVNCKILND